jgi:predicted lysophospholipase L1 biosynthesis ABC-type transport system permease subunit
VNPTLTFRPRRLLLVALVAIVIGALAIALAPGSHHGHHTTADASAIFEG